MGGTGGAGILEAGSSALSSLLMSVATSGPGNDDDSRGLMTRSLRLAGRGDGKGAFGCGIPTFGEAMGWIGGSVAAGSSGRGGTGPVGAGRGIAEGAGWAKVF